MEKQANSDKDLLITKIDTIDTETLQLTLTRPYLKSKNDLKPGVYVNLMTDNSISFSKALILRKYIQSKECEQVQSDLIEDGQKPTPEKIRYLVYEVEINGLNRTNLTEQSLDRDPMTVKWRIEAETFNKALFTLMRTNLSNFLTNRVYISKVKLLVEN